MPSQTSCMSKYLRSKPILMHTVLDLVDLDFFFFYRTVICTLCLIIGLRAASMDLASGEVVSHFLGWAARLFLHVINLPQFLLKSALS